MKKISEHLGQIIIALVGVALLIAACVVFRAPIGDFFNSIIGKETTVGGQLISSMENVNLSDVSSGVVVHSGKIPNGGLYVTAEGTEYEPGDAFPMVNVDDTYEYDDYLYTYSSSGWRVALNTAVTDKEQTSYGTILESINGEPVTDMTETFKNCGYMAEAPAIPAGVTNMTSTFKNCTRLATVHEIPNGVTTLESTFYGCHTLTTAPAIPSSVTNMISTFKSSSLTTTPTIPYGVSDISYAFQGCKKLVVAPEIPSSVTKLAITFQNCTALTGTIEINANPASTMKCFNGTTQPIILTGSSTMLETLAATAPDGNVTVE